MNKYEVIKAKLENHRSNMIDEKLITIKNFANHFKYNVDEVRNVVTELIAEGKMGFKKPLINESSKFYNTEFLTILKKRKIQTKDNSWKYRL